MRGKHPLTLKKKKEEERCWGGTQNIKLTKHITVLV
jgi:hypothetical protein